MLVFYLRDWREARDGGEEGKLHILFLHKMIWDGGAADYR